jgi:hypothetical protein
MGSLTQKLSLQDSRYVIYLDDDEALADYGFVSWNKKDKEYEL